MAAREYVEGLKLGYRVGRAPETRGGQRACNSEIASRCNALTPKEPGERIEVFFRRAGTGRRHGSSKEGVVS